MQFIKNSLGIQGLVFVYIKGGCARNIQVSLCRNACELELQDEKAE